MDHPDLLPSRAAGARVSMAAAFLREHAAEGVRIADLSRLAGLSDRTLRKAFRREYGISPKQFELRLRLHEARRVLCDVTMRRSVTEVASELGFFELGRFAQRYKSAFGESPSQTLKHREHGDERRELR
jgi:AraC-like DNA-binding protein